MHVCSFTRILRLSGLVCATWACGLWPSDSAPLPRKTDSPSFSISWLHFSKWSWWRSGSLRKGTVRGEAGPFGNQEQQHRMETVTTKKLVLQKEEQLEWVSQASVSHNCVLLGNIFGKRICKNKKTKRAKTSVTAELCHYTQVRKIDPMVRSVTFLKLIEKGGGKVKKVL